MHTMTVQYHALHETDIPLADIAREAGLPVFGSIEEYSYQEQEVLEATAVTLSSQYNPSFELKSDPVVLSV